MQGQECQNSCLIHLMETISKYHSTQVMAEIVLLEFSQTYMKSESQRQSGKIGKLALWSRNCKHKAASKREWL